MCTVDCAINSVVAAKQAELASKISISIAAKQLQSVRQQGDAVVALLDAAAQLGKEAGKGAGIDLQG